MGTCLSGAGTGMGVTQAERRLILSARPRALTGWYAAGHGTATVGTRVLPIGSTSTRAAGTTSSVSVWPAPEFCGLFRRNAQAAATGGILKNGLHAVFQFRVLSAQNPPKAVEAPPSLAAKAGHGAGTAKNGFTARKSLFLKMTRRGSGQ